MSQANASVRTVLRGKHSQLNVNARRNSFALQSIKTSFGARAWDGFWPLR